MYEYMRIKSSYRIKYKLYTQIVLPSSLFTEGEGEEGGGGISPRSSCFTAKIAYESFFFFFYESNGICQG